jgi:hypothetical protein
MWLSFFLVGAIQAIEAVVDFLFLSFRQLLERWAGPQSSSEATFDKHWLSLVLRISSGRRDVATQEMYVRCKHQ